MLELKSYNSLINFNKLDTVLDAMFENNLNPGLELMGNPGGVFTDFSNKAERDLWFKVIFQLVQRYSQRLVFVIELDFRNETKICQMQCFFTNDTLLPSTFVFNASLSLELQIRFGSDYVREWKFETWNEPDHGDFCGLELGLESYLAYFDVSLSAIKSALRDAKVGLESMLEKILRGTKVDGVLVWRASWILSPSSLYKILFWVGGSCLQRHQFL